MNFEIFMEQYGLALFFFIAFLLGFIVEVREKRTKKRLLREFNSPRLLSQKEAGGLLEIRDYKDNKILLRKIKVKKEWHLSYHWLIVEEDHWYEASNIPEKMIIISQDEEDVIPPAIQRDACGITFIVTDQNQFVFTKFSINSYTHKIMYY